MQGRILIFLLRIVVPVAMAAFLIDIAIQVLLS